MKEASMEACESPSGSRSSHSSSSARTPGNVAVSGITADVAVEIVCNEARRLRIGKVDVTLHTNLASDDRALASCLGTFEDFCMVTQSVRQGIDVTVRVEGNRHG